MKFEVNPQILKKAMSIAKIVKPHVGDFTISISGSTMKIHSYDKRRSVVSSIKIDATESINDEFYLPIDRSVIFESELSSLIATIGQSGLTLKFSGEKKSQTATVKRRSENSRRIRVPDEPDSSGYSKIESSLLQNVLRQVSCSALVKETKTDDDMRVNQVHFYPEIDGSGYVSSNSRFHASIVKIPGFGLDLSIVSSDIPIIRSFCTKFSNDLYIGSTQKAVNIVDRESGSWLSVAKVVSEKPKLSVPDEKFRNSASITHEDFKKSSRWASLTLEGTQRVTFQISDGSLSMSSGKSELCSVPIISGEIPGIDLPVKILMVISDHMDDDNLNIRYGIIGFPDVLEFNQENEKFSARHFVRCMKSK